MESWQGLSPEIKEKYTVVHIIKRTESKEIVLLQERNSDTRVLLRNYPGQLSAVYQLLVGKTLEHIPQVLEARQQAGG